MNSRAGKAIIVCLLVTFLFSLPNYVFAEIQTPENVRIGLYFTSISSHMETAVSDFYINSRAGLQIGFFENEKFTVLYEEPTSNNIIIRKDSHFVINEGSFTGYDPTADNIPAGQRIGPYHVQIGGDFSDLNLLNIQLDAVRQKGIDAYAAFTGTWKIWTGFYIDLNEAEQSIANDIVQKLGEGAYAVVQPAPNRIVAVTSKNQTALIYGYGTGLCQIRPKAENNPYAFNINDTCYRGIIEVRRITGSDMTVINILSLEQYLYGVIPYEIGAGSHEEALKAQAVAARTYTLCTLGKYNQLGFDLCTTTSCQVYKGFSGETPKSNKAVDDTKGKKLTYNGKLAQTFFFSSSGGRTEDAKNVWGTDIPYLKSVEDRYESGKSRYYEWESIYSAGELKNILLGLNNDIGDITNTAVTKVSESGRAIELEIKGTKAAGPCVFLRENCRYKFSLLRSQWYTITTDADVSVRIKESINTETQLGDKKVMTAKGLKTIRAANYKISVLGAQNKKYSIPVIPTEYVFTGKGWGHAVGMSQEGAKGMANAGIKYDKILLHYFLGTKLE